MTNDINRRNAQNADSRQAQTLEDLLFGTSTERRQGGGDVVRDTLRGDQAGRTEEGFRDDLLSSEANRDATRAGLTGDFEGDRTLAGSNADKANANQRIVQLLAAEEAGTINFGSSRDAIMEMLGLGNGESPTGTFSGEPAGTTVSPGDPNIRVKPDGTRFQLSSDGQEWIRINGPTG